MFVEFVKVLKVKLNDVLTADFFFSHVLIPLAVVTLYFVSFSWLLPEGVNQVFMARAMLKINYEANF